MKVIATNGNLELHEVDETHGYVVDKTDGSKSPLMLIANILSRGDWEVADDEPEPSPDTQP